MAIRIEIAKNYNNLLDLRIGDLTGSTEHSNISKCELLSDISDEIDELPDIKEIPKENNCLNCKHSFRNDEGILNCKMGHTTMVSKGRTCFEVKECKDPTNVNCNCELCKRVKKEDSIPEACSDLKNADLEQDTLINKIEKRFNMNLFSWDKDKCSLIEFINECQIQEKSVPKGCGKKEFDRVEFDEWFICGQEDYTNTIWYCEKCSHQKNPAHNTTKKGCGRSLGNTGLKCNEKELCKKCKDELIDKAKEDLKKDFAKNRRELI